MDFKWLDESVIGHPGIENRFLAHLDKEQDLERALKIVRMWGEQEMTVSLALSTQWLPIIHRRIWEEAFFERSKPSRLPLNFEDLLNQSHGLVLNMAEEFGEHDIQNGHPTLLYKLLRKLGTNPETWVSTPESDELARIGTELCLKKPLADCVGYLWGAEKYAELEFTRILAALTRLGADEDLLVYWKVNVGADQEHSDSLARLVNTYVGDRKPEERRSVVDSALLFFEHKVHFFDALARQAGI